MTGVDEQAFIINGERKFIYGGEFHYFRVSKKDWTDRIKKVKDAGCNLISTYIPWTWHEKEEGKIDLSGKTTPERDLITFLKAVEEQDMYCLVRPGPYVMSEIKNHGIPYWINEKYPEVVARRQDGQTHPTDVISYLHPVFIEKVDAWYKAVCEVIAPMQITEGKNVIMLQLDNEVGMLQWVTNQADYNEDTLNRFTKCISEKYKLEKLQDGIGVNVKQYRDLIDIIKNPSETCAVKLQNEFMLFMRKYYREYIEVLKGIAVKYGIKVPFIVNVHGFDSSDYAKRGGRYPIGLSQLYEAVKQEGIVAAGDYYIGNIVHDNYHDVVLANAFTKAIQGKDQPLFSAEFQGGFQYGIPRLQPTTFDLTTRLCIANGMNSLNYYMFVGGENYEDIGLLGRRHDWQAPVSADGSLKAHYYTIQYLGNVIKAIEEDLLKSKRDVATYLAFYPEYYMTEYSNKYTREMYDRLKVFREAFLYNGIGRGLTLNNITYEGYDVKREGRIDADDIKSLWMLSSHWMDEDIQDKLVQYVNDGGKLVLFPAVPTMDMKGNPCTKLLEALEVQIEESFWHKYVVFEDLDSISAGYIETYEGKGVEGFASIQGVPDKTCAFEKKLGKGKVVIWGIGLELEHFYKDEIIRRLAAKIDNYPVTSRNDYIDVSFRSIPGTNTRFMFIQNYDEYQKTMVFDYFGNTLFDGKELTVRAREGLILPLNYKVGKDTEIIYSTCELVYKEDSKLKVFCKQNLEIIKITKRPKIMTEGIDCQLVEEADAFRLCIKDSINREISIIF